MQKKDQTLKDGTAMTPVLLEICAVSMSSALAAMHGGAGRVELCSALQLGGLTPSAGLISRVCTLPSLRVHVLIRPREGDFCYNEVEKQTMLDDVRLARKCGAHGVVVGALLSNGRADIDFLARLRDEAAGMSITFHRAFDVCSCREETLEQLVGLGYDRILTSGGKPTAEEGVPAICALQRQAAGRISLMPGCGVTVGNAARIIKETGAHEIHASAKRLMEGTMRYHNSQVLFGRTQAESDSYVETDWEQVCAIVDALKA